MAHRTLHFECLEARLPLTSDGVAPLVAELGEASVAAVVPAAAAADPWAQSRGIYMFSLNAYQGVWAPREWSLADWETWLDAMQFLGLNHLQLPRAPWSERPAETQFELDKEGLWIDILQAAKTRGMTTSLIFGTTWHGSPAQAWHILSPGNSPADPNWQILVNDYAYWANRFGPWVDEWLMGVEDPGGSPSSAGIAYSSETPSPLGNPSDVSELVALEIAMRSAAQAVNPASRVVAETWGLHWWGLSPGYSSHLNEFLARVPTLPADVPLSTHALDNSITNALQATGRDVDAWPFFLIDHEFPVGHTKLHFSWTQNYLRTIKNQGIDDVTAHISHPLEQLPSLYIYSQLLEDTEQSKTTLLREFSSLLVSDFADQVALGNAISNLGLFWDSVSAIANWDPAVLQPVNATAPYAPRYNSTQLGYLNTALTAINAVDSPRAESQLPMIISPAQWLDMLRDQIQFLHNAAYMGNLVTALSTYLNDNHAAVAGLTEPLTRGAAEAIVAGYQNAGSAGAIDAMKQYLQQFWTTTTGQNHPLGIIYDYLRNHIPTAAAGFAGISGDYLEYDAPSHPAFYKTIEGRVEETDASFSYQRTADWVVDTASDAFSGGSAMKTSLNNNEVNIVFSGTGISLVHSLWNQGGTATWSIDGGAGGSGTVDMFAAARQDQVETFLASGLDQTLHVLTIKKTGGAAGSSILVDALNIQNRNRLRNEDDRSHFAYGGAWAELSLGTPSGGAWHYTIDNTATVNIPFTGTAVSIAATTRADYGIIAWKIDGGASGSGIVNLAATNNQYRKPFILATNLAQGQHTLTLSKQSGFLINIDAIDFATETQLSVSADFDADNDVDGRDFLTWQRGFGAPPGHGDRADGDANNDWAVNGEDLSIWSAAFGAPSLATAPPASDQLLTQARDSSIGFIDDVTLARLMSAGRVSQRSLRRASTRAIEPDSVDRVLEAAYTEPATGASLKSHSRPLRRLRELNSTLSPSVQSQSLADSNSISASIRVTSAVREDLLKGQ